MRDSRLADVLRNYTMRIKFVLVLSAASVVLLVLALQAIEPGTATHVLALIQLVTFVLLFVLMAGFLWIVRTAE